MSCSNDAIPPLTTRIAFYLLWAGVPLTAYVRKSEVPPLRFTLFLFTTGLFLSTTIASGNNTLSPLTGYISYLLISAPYFTLVPIYIWRFVSLNVHLSPRFLHFQLPLSPLRLLTMCSPLHDPSAWPRVRHTILFQRLFLLQGIAVTSWNMFFFSEPVKRTCPEPLWGFAFAKVDLQSPLFIAANIIISVFLLIGMVMEIWADFGGWRPRWIRKGARRLEKIKKRLEGRGEVYVWMGALQFVKTVWDLSVYGVVIVGIELVAVWNGTGQGDGVSRGALVPLVLVSGLLGHVWYTWANPWHNVELLEDVSEDFPDLEDEESGSSGSSEEVVEVRRV
ncbi:hypothetical protein OQA88_7765 [Cercophora sp. LCS_1]